MSEHHRTFYTWNETCRAPQFTYTEVPKTTAHPVAPWATRSYTTRLSDDLDQKEIQRLRSIAEDLEVSRAIILQQHNKRAELVQLAIVAAEEWRNLRGLQRTNCGSEFMTAMRNIGRYVGVLLKKK